MKSLIRSISNNVMLSRLSRVPWNSVLIAVFCFCLPFGTRTTLHSGATPYDTIFLYGTDLLALAAALLNIRLISKHLKDHAAIRTAFGVCAVFVTIGAVSAFESADLYVGFFNLLRIVIFSVLAIWIGAVFSDSHASKIAAYSLFVSAMTQSVFAWIQFVSQKDLGLRLLGEQTLGPDLAGVAKIDIVSAADGAYKLIRAYGTFPHPNILAAFLIVAAFAAAVEYMRRPPKNAALNTLFLGGFALILTTIAITFSRGIWISGLAGLVLFGGSVWISHKKIGSSHKYRIAALGIVFVGAVLFSLAAFRTEIAARADISISGQDVQMRLSGAYQALKMIDANKFFGVGPGQFVSNIDRYAGSLPEKWMYQPVHDIYLLMASEYGLLGLLAFLCFLYMVVRAHIRTNRLEKILACGALPVFVALLIAGLADHFFFTFQQGALIFWLAVGMMLACIPALQSDSVH